MSILIKGMEMPTDHPLWLVVHADGTVEASEVSPSRPVGWQTLRNAAVPVPPHGRLIDADVLDGIMVEQSGEEYNHHHAPRTWERALSCFRDYIKDAPTIIPAEETLKEATT